MRPDERQDAPLFVRMRPGDVKVLRELAHAAGMTVGVYAREILKRRIRGARRGRARPRG